MTVLGFDTETGGLDWFDPTHQAFMVQWADDRTPAGTIGVTAPDLPTGSTPEHVGLEETRAAFAEAIDRADVITAHNLPFDTHQTRETLGIDLLEVARRTGKRIVDTAVLSRVVLPERRQKWEEDGPTEDDDTTGFKLKSLGRTYVDSDAKDADEAIAELAKAAKIKLKATGGYFDTWRAFPQEMETYGRMDARLVRELLPKLEAKVGDRFRRVWELEQALQPTLIEAERRGVNVDQSIVSPLQGEYERMREENFDAVCGALGSDWYRTEDDQIRMSPDTLREALLDHGVPLYRLTKKGQELEKIGKLDPDEQGQYLATNQFALKEFEAQFPALKALADFRKADKFLSTYLYPMAGRETVHPNFHQVGAWTGRMSCSRPNMQNIPTRDEMSDTRLRALFVPRPGMCFVVSDYDAIEIRALAYYLNVQWYRDMIRDGLDPHAWMASQIWGGTPEMYHKGTPNEKLRSLAKNILFAIVYGAGAPRVMDMLAAAGMPSTRDAARALIKAIKKALPGYYSFNRRVRDKVETVQHVNTLFGRKQPVMRDKAYVGVNAVIQGTAADVFKQGVINATAAIAHLGAYPVLFVHDELVSECPVEHAQECLRLQDEAMAAAADIDPALVVSGAIALNNYAEGK